LTWFAQSIFGEDALANVSLERLEDGKVKGHMRIRSKTQVCALRRRQACPVP
jgi:coatomer subunit beta